MERPSTGIERLARTTGRDSETGVSIASTQYHLSPSHKALGAIPCRQTASGFQTLKSGRLNTAEESRTT